MSKRRNNVKCLTLCAVFVAMSLGLGEIKIFHMPWGGSLSLLAMLPTVLCGYFCGPYWGLIAAVSRGLLDLALDSHVFYPAQLILDYVLGFGVLGISGFFSEKKEGLRVGYAVAVLGRLFFSSLSGYIFFGEYAWDGWNPILYAVVYNFSYIGTEGIITLIILSIPKVKRMLANLKSNMYN